MSSSVFRILMWISKSASNSDTAVSSSWVINGIYRCNDAYWQWYTHPFLWASWLSLDTWLTQKLCIYLLYSTRPKYSNNTYYVRIDVYDRATFKYYASMFHPIRFPFLPVHRLSLQVNIHVRESLIISKKCPLKCLH
jgi:hypothetical protein